MDRARMGEIALVYLKLKLHRARTSSPRVRVNEEEFLDDFDLEATKCGVSREEVIEFARTMLHELTNNPPPRTDDEISAAVQREVARAQAAFERKFQASVFAPRPEQPSDGTLIRYRS